MEEVLVTTKPKDSFKLVVLENRANIQTAFNPSLYLQASRNYKLANIRVGDNNSFKWSVDGSKT